MAADLRVDSALRRRPPSCPHITRMDPPRENSVDIKHGPYGHKSSPVQRGMFASARSESPTIFIWPITELITLAQFPGQTR